MSTPDFAQLLRVEEEILAAQLRAVRASIAHPGEKGRGLEQHAVALLRRFLPAEYGVATGFIAAAHCREGGGHDVTLSPQCDAIIFDAIRGAPIVDLGSCHVLPLECVHAAVEVKTTLYGSADDLYGWSARVRQLRTRHYMFDPDREVNPGAEARRGARRVWHAAAGTSSPDSVGVIMPRQQAIAWLPVRCFALAFEIGGGDSFSLDRARQHLAERFVDPGHFHAVLVPDRCVLWNERADRDPTQLGKVSGSDVTPLATFRHRLLDALANFPRPSADATMDLTPYFESAGSAAL